MLYVRELLRDTVYGHVDDLTRLDLMLSLTGLYQTGQISYYDVATLELWLRGYSILELAFIGAPQERLIRCLSLLAEVTDYTDEGFARKVVQQYPKYKPILPALVAVLEKHGREFN